MIKLIRQGVYYTEEGRVVTEAHAFMTSDKKEKAVARTMSYALLRAHGGTGEGTAGLRFDALVSDAATCIGIAETADTAFALPYTVMGEGEGRLSAATVAAAKKLGADLVPARLAAPHAYINECCAKGGEAILCAGVKPACGALGTLGVCGDADALIAQRIGRTYELPAPQTVAVYLRGKLRKGVGPTDVALALVKAAAKSSFAKGKLLEFIGPGVARLSMDCRCAIDALAAATGCFATLWETDERTREYFEQHGRAGDFVELHPGRPAYYDGAITVDLARVEPMLAFAAVPGEAVAVAAFLADPIAVIAQAERAGRKLDPAFTLAEAFSEGTLRVGAAVAAGGYEELAEAAEQLRGNPLRAPFALLIRPQSAPVARELAENGYLTSLIDAGAAVQSGCIPAPQEGVLLTNAPCGHLPAGAVIMDVRSIAATAMAGTIASALGTEGAKRLKKYKFNGAAYAGVRRAHEGENA